MTTDSTRSDETIRRINRWACWLHDCQRYHEPPALIKDIEARDWYTLLREQDAEIARLREALTKRPTQPTCDDEGCVRYSAWQAEQYTEARAERDALRDTARRMVAHMQGFCKNCVEYDAIVEALTSMERGQFATDAS